jgi:hypothetical protein
MMVSDLIEDILDWNTHLVGFLFWPRPWDVDDDDDDDDDWRRALTT